MSRYKNIIFMIGVSILIIMLALILNFNLGENKNNDKNNHKNNEQIIIGGDKDSHGCISSAGYSLSEEENKCIRIWGEQNGVAKTSNLVPEFYKKLQIIDQKEVEIEISRSLKDCFGIKVQKCMQVRPKGEEWELYYDPIYGFDYNEGDYYLLKVKETDYDFSDQSIVPADVSSKTWELIKIIKQVKPEKSQKWMNVKIPALNYSEEKNDFLINFSEHKVPKNDMVLTSTLEELFKLRSNGDDGIWNGLKFDKVNIENGIAYIDLKGSWYPDGDMSGMYMKREIQAAVFQFNSIDKYEVSLNGKLFDWCIDDESDGESGCPEEAKYWKETRK